jgi:hypothetical protein
MLRSMYLEYQSISMISMNLLLHVMMVMMLMCEISSSSSYSIRSSSILVVVYDDDDVKCFDYVYFGMMSYQCYQSMRYSLSRKRHCYYLYLN